MSKKNKISQSIIEYVAIVVIVSAALGAMSFYIQRVLAVRTRHLNQELNEATRGIFGLW
ncbi:MAG: hypothetical protein NC918_06090 [Candidatus Omnitrophica bacterium]|nr:hypothetical protein [Candidatus Omnitrophota bacterium]